MSRRRRTPSLVRVAASRTEKMYQASNDSDHDLKTKTIREFRIQRILRIEGTVDVLFALHHRCGQEVAGSIWQ